MSRFTGEAGRLAVGPLVEVVSAGSGVSALRRSSAPPWHDVGRKNPTKSNHDKHPPNIQIRAKTSAAGAPELLDNWSDKQILSGYGVAER